MLTRSQVLDSTTKRRLGGSRSKSKGKGFAAFTLVELVIVIFIIGIISAITLANYRSGARRIDLTLAAQKLALDIRRAQQFAVATRLQNNQPPCGYGLHFDNTVLPTASVTLFAEMSALPGCNGGIAFDDPGRERVQNIPLSGNVRITRFSHSTTGALAIAFLPPTPITVFTSGSTALPDAQSSVEITLSLVTDPTLESTVRVFRWGQITITGP